MWNRLACLSALLLFASPLNAAPTDFDQTFSGPLNGLMLDVRHASPKPAGLAAVATRENALRTTLTAMQDGNEVGEMLVAYAQEHKIKIEFQKQEAPSTTGKDATITLSDALPAYPRVFAPLIAREISTMLLSEMAESSEKAYMRLSLEVRSWLELGGDRKTFPVIESLTGYRNEAITKSFGIWLDNIPEAALQKVGEQANASSILELQYAAETRLQQTPAGDPTRAALETTINNLKADNKRFTDFLIAENAWRRLNAGR